MAPGRSRTTPEGRPGPTDQRGNVGRPEEHPRRLVLDAIFYLVVGGIAWAALPHDFPPTTTVCGLYARWVKAGSWRHIHDALRDLVRLHEGRDPAPTAAMIDSPSVRGADTVLGASRGYDAGKKVNGRKRHIAVDTGGLLLAVVVTVAGLQDRDAGHRLFTAPRARFATVSLVWADGGYAGGLVVWARAVLTLGVETVKRTDDLAGFHVLPRRWVVERTFAWISKRRRCVRDRVPRCSPRSCDGQKYVPHQGSTPVLNSASARATASARCTCHQPVLASSDGARSPR